MNLFSLVTRHRLLRVLFVFTVWLSCGGWNSAAAQTDIVFVSTFQGNSQPVKICTTDTLSFPVVLTNQSFPAGDSARFELNLPAGVELLQVLGTNLTVYQQNADLVRCAVEAGTTTDTLMIQLVCKIGCDLFSADPALVHEITGTVRWTRPGTGVMATDALQNRFLAIKNGVLSLKRIDDALMSAPLMGTVERCFIYMNTSTHDSLWADITFGDSILLKGTSNWIRITDAHVQQPQPWLTQAIASVSDTVAGMTISVRGMPPLDSLIICDSVQLLKCPHGSIDSSQTEFHLSYGCPDEDTCEDLVDPLQNLTSLELAPGAPDLKFVREAGPFVCISNGRFHRFKIWNGGTADAFGLTVQHFFQWASTLSFVDTNTIDIYGLDHQGNRLPYVMESLPAHLRLPSYHVAPGRVGHNVHVDTTIAVGDTLYLEFQELMHCPDTMSPEQVMTQIGVLTEGLVLRARLNHSCRPSIKALATHHRNQQFKLNQFPTSLIGNMKDGEEAWFAMRNNGRMRVANLYDGGIYYNPEHFRIRVAIKLDSGLCFADGDSVHLWGMTSDTIIPPDWIQVMPGTAPTHCTADSLIASFSLPPTFYNGMARTHLFNRFFDNFEVRFRLRADCRYVDFSSNSKAKMTQTVYVVLDTTCSPECAIPISIASDGVNINCPGCYVPGWNLDAFSFRRLTLGTSDTNNNHFPDQVVTNLPVDPQDANLQEIMIGDTVSLDISAFISDGSDSAGYTFSDLTFPFHHAVAHIKKCEILTELTPVAVACTLTEANGSTNTFSFSTDDPAFGAYWYHNAIQGSFTLSLDSAIWNLLGTAPFSRYRPGQELDVQLIFRVANNLTGGQGLPHLGRYEASAFIFMSGTPYNLLYPEQKVDVLSIDRSDLIDPLQYSMTDLSNLTYWCTGWEGRVRGIGAGFTQGFREVVNAQGNICLKLLRMRATGTAGMTVGHFGQNSQPAGYRAFAFELRNLFMLDSVQMELPPHYSLSGARISLRHVRNWGSGDLPSEPQRDFPAYQMDVHSGYVTFRFHDWVEQWVTEPVLNGNGQANNAVFASFFDETKRYTLVVDLLTDDCTVNVDSTVPLSVSSWYHNNPLQQSPVTNQIQFDLERNTPNFATNATNFQIDNQADLSFDFSIVPNGIGWQFAPNVFLWGTSRQGSVHITSMTKLTGSQLQAVSGLHQGQPIWNLGLLSGRYRNNYKYHVQASYDCAQVTGVDTLVLYYGYSCDTVVTNLDSNTLCQLDSMLLPIVYSYPGIQSTHHFPSAVEVCDTAWYTITLNATGNKRVENVNVELTLPNGMTVHDLTANGLPDGELTFAGNTQTVAPQPSGNLLHFDLSALLPNFIGTLGQTAVLRIPIALACDYQLPDPVLAKVTATDFCGKPLQETTGTYAPVNYTGNYDFGALSLSGFTYEPLTTCTDSGRYTIDVSNASVQASGSFVVAFYCEGDVNGPLQPLCAIGQTGALQLSGSASQTFTVTLPPTCPDCEQLLAVIEPVGNCFCGQPNDTARTTVYCGECLTTADFTYAIVEGCVLQAEDHSTGILPVTDWWWRVTDRLSGNTVATSNVQHPDWSGLTSPDLEVCLVVWSNHDSTCADTFCKVVDLCCVPDVDTCELLPDFTVDGRTCDVTFTSTGAATNAGTVTYRWDIIPPGASAPVYFPIQSSPVFNYQAAADGFYKVCLTVYGSEGCEAEICKMVPLVACPDPCEFEGDLKYWLDEKTCTYHLELDQTPSGQVSYVWDVRGPNSQPVPSPNANAAQLTFQPLENGMHTACVVVTWIIGQDTCIKEICTEIEVTDCGPDPCEWEANIQLEFDEEHCQYRAWLAPSPTGNPAFFWQVQDGNGNLLSLSPGPSNASVTFAAQQAGAHKICVDVSWTAGETKCENRWCTEEELKVCDPKPCETEGAIRWNFVPNECQYELKFDNLGGVNILSYNWSATSQPTSGAATPVPVLPNAAASTVVIDVTPGLAYVAYLTLTWQDGERKCEQEFKVWLPAQKCPEPCDVSATFSVQRNRRTCQYTFTQSNTANTIWQRWEITDMSGNLMHTQTGPVLTWTPPQNGGAFQIKLFVQGNTKKCRDERTLVIEAPKCRPRWWVIFTNWRR